MRPRSPGRPSSGLDAEKVDKAQRAVKRLRERRLRQLEWLAQMEHLRDWPHRDGAARPGPGESGDPRGAYGPFGPFGPQGSHGRWGPFDPHDPRARAFDRRMRRDWRWHWRARQRWHQRWHRHHANFNHSLGARLIAIFMVLAVLSSVIVWAVVRHEVGLIWAVPLLLLVTGLAYGGIRHMVRPLSALAEGAEAFGRGELDHRVPIFHRDEIGDLAMRFNQMAADIQAMLDGKRALLLAISHELRSPLTRARLHAELVEEGASKGALLDELGQMRDLIAALLETERLDSGHAALHLAPCDLEALAREQAQPGVILQTEPGLPSLSLDKLRIQLLLRNLVHNALRHNEPSWGAVIVSLAGEDGGIRLTVRDHGPGVPPEALPQLGQPFYRPDEARSRTDGGVGLGLSLCRLVAEAHGSRLELRNAEPGFEASVLLK